jgi:hypothetical protein
MAGNFRHRVGRSACVLFRHPDDEGRGLRVRSLVRYTLQQSWRAPARHNCGSARPGFGRASARNSARAGIMRDVPVTLFLAS